MKRYNLGLDDKTHRQLKAHAAMRGLTIGELIQGLVKFANYGKYFPENEQKRFNGHLDTCFLNVGNMSKDRVKQQQAAGA